MKTLLLITSIALVLSAGSVFAIDWKLPVRVDGTPVGTLAEVKSAYNWGEVEWVEKNGNAVLTLSDEISIFLHFQFLDDHYRINKIRINGESYEFEAEIAASMIKATVKEFTKGPILAMPISFK